MTMVIPKIQTRTGHPFSGIQDLLSSMGPRPVSFSIDNQTGGQMISPNGFRYEIAPGTCANAWGQPVSETIHLRTTEIFDKRALFFSDQSCNSDQRLLDVLCGLHLHLDQQQHPGVRQIRPIRVVLPFGKNTRLSDLSIYQKHLAKTNLLQGEERLVWSPTAQSLFTQRHEQKKEIFFYLSSPGAYLIGRHLRGGRKNKDRAMLSVLLPEASPKLKQIRAFLVFHESDTILHMEQQRERFTAFHLPKGKKASLLLIGYGRRQYYWQRIFLGPLSNQRLEGNLKPIDAHQLQAALQRMIF